jgi:hypothetical protein
MGNIPIDAGEPRWISLNDALDRVQSLEDCNALVAQVLLKYCIGEGLIPVKWDGSKGRTSRPDIGFLSRSQFVLLGSGHALRSNSLCALLVLHSAINRWSEIAARAFEERLPSLPEKGKLGDASQRWMSLVQATERVRMLEGCDSVRALVSLKREMKDGMLEVAWDDTKGNREPPDPKYLHDSQLLLIGAGLAPDRDGGVYRPLSVSRSDVDRIWPMPKRREKGSTIDREILRDEDYQSQRRPVSEPQIRERLRGIYSDPRSNRPNVNQAWTILKKQLPNASKSRVMEVLKEDEFASRRRKPGNQPKD